MDENPKTESKTKKGFKLLLKIVVSIACLWYVSGKIDFEKAWQAVQSVHFFYLFLAVLAFILSKIISAVRLNTYFKNTCIHLGFVQNIKLYWLGMFYNLFLPGSITGDAYKVILLKKRYNAPYKKTMSAVLLDRFSGLLGLGLILGVYSILVFDQLVYAALVVGGSILAVFILHYIVNRWMKDFSNDFFLALLLGLLVQAAQVLCVYLVMSSLGISSDKTAYVFIFLVSSVVSVLPLTIGGGLGIREFVFLEGSIWFGLDKDTAVVISLLFYFITLIGSTPGLFFVFRDPLTKK